MSKGYIGTIAVLIGIIVCLVFVLLSTEQPTPPTSKPDMTRQYCYGNNSDAQFLFDYYGRDSVGIVSLDIDCKSGVYTLKSSIDRFIEDIEQNAIIEQQNQVLDRKVQKLEIQLQNAKAEAWNGTVPQ